MTGRPSLYTPELAQEIFERLIEGESLRQICSSESMPNRSTIQRWLAADEAFATSIAQAREAQGDLMDDLVYDTAKECSNETFQADRVKIAAYQWRAAHLKPKKYGPKTETTHVGDKERPVVIAPLDAAL